MFVSIFVVFFLSMLRVGEKVPKSNIRLYREAEHISSHLRGPIVKGWMCFPGLVGSFYVSFHHNPPHTLTIFIVPALAILLCTSHFSPGIMLLTPKNLI